MKADFPKSVDSKHQYNHLVIMIWEFNWESLVNLEKSSKEFRERFLNPKDLLHWLLIVEVNYEIPNEDKKNTIWSSMIIKCKLLP